MLKKITGTFLVASLSIAAFAQDSTKAITISGSVDAYYRYNGGKDTTGGGFKNSYTSFTGRPTLLN